MVRLINYSVYILTNKHKTVFYTGVTSDLQGRVLQHKQGEGGQFTSKYNCTYLMYYEEYTNVRNAIAREKQLKRWLREWKLDLIRKDNPAFLDLAAAWYK